MSKFFDSEQVQDTLEDIEELQKRVQDGMLSYGGGFIEFWQEDEKIYVHNQIFFLIHYLKYKVLQNHILSHY